jgi:hypothetical protein
VSAPVTFTQTITTSDGTVYPYPSEVDRGGDIQTYYDVSEEPFTVTLTPGQRRTILHHAKTIANFARLGNRDNMTPDQLAQVFVAIDLMVAMGMGLEDARTLAFR